MSAKGTAQRFTDVEKRPQIIPGIDGLDDVPLVDLMTAVADVVNEPSIKLSKGMLTTVENCLEEAEERIEEKKDQGIAEPLNCDELAAILLYSREFSVPELSWYAVLNRALREKNRRVLVPFHKYLRLFAAAVQKLKPYRGKVARGIRLGVEWATYYRDGKKFRWWGFTSSTQDPGLLESNGAFLGSSGQRTLFQINCTNGVQMAPYSAYPEEKEVLLLPGTRFEVVNQGLPLNEMAIVTLKEIKPSFMWQVGKDKTMPVAAPAVVAPAPTPTYAAKPPSAASAAPVHVAPSAKYAEGPGYAPQQRQQVLAVVEREANRLQMFRLPDLKPYRTLATGSRPYDVSYSAGTGLLYVACRSYVQAMAKDGTVIKKFAEDLKSITSVAVTRKTNHILIGQETSKTIHVFSGSTYKLTAKFDVQKGGTGVSNIAVDARDNIFVSVFNGSHGLQAFGPNYQFVEQLLSKCKVRDKTSGVGVYYPWGLAFNAYNQLVCADGGNHRVVQVDVSPYVNPSGRILSTSGTGSSGSKKDEYHFPRGVAVDESNNIYVVDRDNFRLKRLNPQLRVDLVVVPSKKLAKAYGCCMVNL